MDSFVSAKNDASLLNLPSETRSKQSFHNISSMKASSSFIIPSKSPLSTCKNKPVYNYITKNKKSLKTICATEDCRKKQSRSKRFKRTLSKKSIGNSANKSSCYSTSKIKGSFVSNKPSENASIIKYNSFINSCKVSPSRTKSNERVPKKSQRKLDMNIKKSRCGQRKKSNSSKGTAKILSTTAST